MQMLESNDENIKCKLFNSKRFAYMKFLLLGL